MDNSADMSESLAPVFMELGKALQICQAFESTLCLLLSLMANERSDGQDGAFEAAWDFHSKKPLGKMLAALRQQIDVPADLDAYLGIGVEKRNKIVHGFMTQNAQRLYEPKGRLQLEQELAELKLEVKKRDIVANKLLDALLKKYGTSNEQLKRRADELWNHLNPQTPGDPAIKAH